MSRYALATLILQLLMLQPIVASPIGFRFSGVVSGFPPSPMPFGISIPAGSNVTGHFFYEPSSAATHLLPCSGECIGYRQQLPNGFGATFDGAVVRADEYVVVISDNVAGGGDKLDTVAIRFSNTLNLEVPLVVNGVSRPNSQFSVSMNAHQTLLPDARLPPTLNPVDYPASGRGGVLDNTSAAGIDLFFSVAVLEPIAPGDYNFDGTVDAMDYSTWKSEFGSTTAWAPDGNHNGQVDAGDYTIWRDRFDAVSENLSNLSVPEPHPLHFAFVVGALFFVARSSCRLPRSRSVLQSRTSGAHSAFTLLELLVAL
jgi:hypothetical protein